MVLPFFRYSMFAIRCSLFAVVFSHLSITRRGAAQMEQPP